MKKKKIKVLIAYDQQLVAEGLSSILKRIDAFQVLDSFPNGMLAFDGIKKMVPEIVIVELARWPCHYLNYLKNIVSIDRGIKLVVISERIAQRSLLKVMMHANAYLLYTCSAANVATAIDEILKAGKYICSNEIEEFIISSGDINSNLTQREEEILSNWLCSNNNGEIAQKLSISESTVRSHLKNVRQKIKSDSNIQMMVYACKSNILKLGRQPICPNCRYSCHDFDLA